MDLADLLLGLLSVASIVLILLLFELGQDLLDLKQELLHLPLMLLALEASSRANCIFKSLDRCLFVILISELLRDI